MDDYRLKARVTENEYDALMKYAKEADYSIVEIGILKGGTTKGFSDNAKAGVAVYGVDIFQREDTAKPDILYRDVFCNYNNTFIIVADANKIGKFFDIKIGLLFIDGCHDYEFVKENTILWCPKVAYGGYIIFHDAAFTNNNTALDGYVRNVSCLSGVSKAIDELLFNKEYKVVEVVDSIVVIQKCFDRDLDILGH